MGNYFKVSVKEDTYKKFRNEGYKMFLKHNPALMDISLSEDYVFKRMLEYYLDEKPLG